MKISKDEKGLENKKCKESKMVTCCYSDISLPFVLYSMYVYPLQIFSTSNKSS